MELNGSAQCQVGEGVSTAAGRGRDTFDGRVIFVDEMRLDELDGQTGLSHTSSTDYDQLVFPEELRHDCQ